MSLISQPAENDVTLLWQVADFFAHLVKRFSPKSYTQALAEVKITQRFLENFSGDSVSFPFSPAASFNFVLHHAVT